MNTSMYGYVFRCVGEISPLRNEDNSIYTYTHNKEGKYINSHYHSFGNKVFCKFSIPEATASSGVYIIKDIENDNIYYIGECANLKNRYNCGYGNISPRNVFIGGRSTNCKVNNSILEVIKSGKRLHLFFMETPYYKDVERRILASIPIVNRKNFWNSKWP